MFMKFIACTLSIFLLCYPAFATPIVDTIEIDVSDQIDSIQVMYPMIFSQSKKDGIIIFHVYNSETAEQSTIQFIGKYSGVISATEKFGLFFIRNSTSSSSNRFFLYAFEEQGEAKEIFDTSTSAMINDEMIYFMVTDFDPQGVFPSHNRLKRYDITTGKIDQLWNFELNSVSNYIENVEETGGTITLSLQLSENGEIYVIINQPAKVNGTVLAHTVILSYQPTTGEVGIKETVVDYCGQMSVYNCFIDYYFDSGYFLTYQFARFSEFAFNGSKSHSLMDTGLFHWY